MCTSCDPVVTCLPAEPMQVCKYLQSLMAKGSKAAIEEAINRQCSQLDIGDASTVHLQEQQIESHEAKVGCMDTGI